MNVPILTNIKEEKDSLLQVVLVLQMF
uniref:Uncharacterized protein n=1 Tax=Anguilla anguilla TaxID=7936 RepID=A0A0E9T9B0_ANGAN